MIALSSISGVEATVVISATATPAETNNWQPISGYHRPRSGYYNIDSLTINYKPYDTTTSL